MKKFVYDKFSVTLADFNNRYICEHIVSINEYDHEIEIDMEVPVEDVNRGWIGDLYLHMKGFALDNVNTGITSVNCLKEVLCARVKVTADIDSTVIWTYVFLKD